MAKKNDILGELFEALGKEGGNILGDLLEQVTGSTEIASAGDELLEGLMENSGGILQGIGDVVADLTGIGATNTDASDTAKLTGKTKSSAAKKKTSKTSAKTNDKEKPKTQSKPKTQTKPKAESKPKTQAKSKAESKPKTQAKPKTSAAKTKTSAAKKKSN